MSQVGMSAPSAQKEARLPTPTLSWCPTLWVRVVGTGMAGEGAWLVSEGTALGLIFR